MKNANGFTMLELMVSVSVLIILMGMLLTLSISLSSAVESQEAQLSTEAEARKGIVGLTKELRHAARTSIAWGQLPSDQLQYQIPVDLDGNGVPVDIGGFLELGPVITLGRDVNDLNGDGITTSQFIWTNGADVRVLANNLLDDEDDNGNNQLDGGEDDNQNGVLDRGLVFERVGQSVRVTVQTHRQASPRAVAMTATLRQTLTPRN